MMPKPRYIQFKLEQPLDPEDDFGTAVVWGGPDNVMVEGSVFSGEAGSHGIALYDPFDGIYRIVELEC